MSACCRSAPISAGGGNLSRHSNGRHASMIMRELKPLRSRGMIGSSGPLQQRRRISAESTGSAPLHIAHRHAGLLDLIANISCAQKFVAMFRPRRGPVFRRGRDDRIIAVIQAMYLDERLEFLTAGVITGPFAERSFFLAVIRQKLPFDRDLRVRRNRQTGKFPADDFYRFAFDAADGIELASPVGLRSGRSCAAEGRHRSRLRLDRVDPYRSIFAGAGVHVYREKYSCPWYFDRGPLRGSNRR